MKIIWVYSALTIEITALFLFTQQNWYKTDLYLEIFEIISALKLDKFFLISILSFYSN